jgi:hypothetical protein
MTGRSCSAIQDRETEDSGVQFNASCCQERFVERESPAKEGIMNKVLLGIVLGAILGAIDGATAWFTPAVRAGIGGIIIGSTVKGIIAGVVIGLFARKVHSVLLGILFGLAVGFALAFVIAQLQHGYYLQIILPGSLVGVILGYATQRYGTDRTSAAATRAALPR